MSFSNSQTTPSLQSYFILSFPPHKHNSVFVKMACYFPLWPLTVSFLFAKNPPPISISWIYSNLNSSKSICLEYSKAYRSVCLKLFLICCFCHFPSFNPFQLEFDLAEWSSCHSSFCFSSVLFWGNVSSSLARLIIFFFPNELKVFQCFLLSQNAPQSKTEGSCSSTSVLMNLRTLNVTYV